MAEVADRPMGSRNKVLVLEPAIRCGALNPVALNQCPGDLSQTVREDPINVASHPRELRGARASGMLPLNRFSGHREPTRMIKHSSSQLLTLPISLSAPLRPPFWQPLTASVCFSSEQSFALSEALPIVLCEQPRFAADLQRKGSEGVCRSHMFCRRPQWQR